MDPGSQLPTSQTANPLQNISLKRKLDPPPSTVPPKKPKVDTEADSPKVKRLISKLSTLREMKKQEKASKPRARTPWPPIFEHEGSPKIVVASFPATPQRDNSPFRDNEKPVVCGDCVGKAREIESLGQKLELAYVRITEREDRIRELESTLLQAEDYRKYVHSQLVELKGPIRVMCRLKPLSPNSQACVTLPELTFGEKHPHTVLWTLNSHRSSYLFDRVFSADASQLEVFEEIKPYIQSGLDGDHVCIFTYGQTGSGKTYTLEGPHFTGNIEVNTGVVPRAAVYLFHEIERQTHTGMSYTVQISCLEIYNDALYDLFTDSEEKLSIKTIHNRVQIDPLHWEIVTNSSDLLLKIASAVQSRVTRDTHLNTASSRSHCLYQLSITGVNSATGNSVSGRINIIDLAGSERANIDTYAGKSAREVADMRAVLSEARFINTSLSCLRRVVSSLIVNKSRGSGLLPPFRESKLTRILQESMMMQGAKILVIVNVCMESDTAGETRESLKFGSDAQFCLS